MVVNQVHLSWPTLLKKILEQKRMGYGTFAKAVGISRESAIRYATGERVPDYNTGLAIASLLDVPVEKLPYLFSPSE